MPTYDYVCRFCEHAFEHFQGIHDKHLRTCPACKRRGLDRLIGRGAGVVFKGSGFYETDYKRAGRQEGDKGPTASGTTDGKASGQDKPTADSPGKAGAPSSTGAGRSSDAATRSDAPAKPDAPPKDDRSSRPGGQPKPDGPGRQGSRGKPGSPGTEKD